jgi:antitoxin component of RelBE/YafQ-DinJ toxin-antitoxin module
MSPSEISELASKPEPEMGINLRFVRPQTTGPWYNWYEAVQQRNNQFPPTALESQTTFVIDLSATYPSPSVLLEYIIPVAQRIKSADNGLSKLIVITNDQATRMFLESLARTNNLPLFVSSSPQIAASIDDLQKAHAVGDVTPTDKQTLEIFARAGGRLSASEFATLAKLRPTAATNRLSTLSRKGYLYRIVRPGRDGDLYVDPRFVAKGASERSSK